MNRNYLIPFLLTLFLLCGCDREIFPDASCVRADLSWEGASAESIAEQLPAIAPSLKLAVIEDGLATVYYEGEKDFVAAELENTRPILPHGMTVRSLEALDIDIPEPPEQMDVVRVQFEPERERMASLGVTMVDLAAAMRGDTDSSPVMEDPEALRSIQVKNFEGKMISISDLGTAEAIIARRPLVLRR